MGAKGSGKQQIADYYMSVHYGFCLGPVDEVKGLIIGDKDVPFEAVANGQLTLDDVDLFGGPKKGGGIGGQVDVYLGGSDQVMFTESADFYGRTPTTMTGYRGVFSLLFRGLGTDGFYWGSNNPVLPGVKARVSRNAVLGNDANPARIIEECFRDTVWGLGEDVDRVDTDAFNAAAALFETENLGLSFKWTKQRKAADFINYVASHVAAQVYFHPDKGQWTIRPVRADYTIEGLPLLNSESAKLEEFSRAAWGELVGEVQVNWTNPVNEKTESVSVFSDRVNEIQDGVVSDSKNYEGARRSGLALRLGLRELVLAGTPLSRGKISANRGQARLYPGDVFIANFPEFNVNDLVCRVLSVDFGNSKAASDTVNFVEDVFASPYYSLIGRGTSWTDPDIEPVPVSAAYLETAPFFLLAAELGETVAKALDYPTVFSAIIVPPDNAATLEIDVMSETTNAAGDLEFTDVATVDVQSSLELSSALLATAASTVFTATAMVGAAPRSGDFLFLSNVSGNQELCVVTGFLAPNQVTVRRACYDTVPSAWPAGTKVAIMTPGSRVLDPTERGASEVATFKLLPITSLGRLSEADSPEYVHTLSDRPHLPYRPANVVVGGQTGPAVNLRTDTAAAVSFARRNRLTETVIALSWTGADVAPEAGQTTTIKIYNGAALITTLAGIAGTSTSLTLANLGNPVKGNTRKIRVSAVRDGLESFQAREVTATFQGENLFAYSHDFSQWGAFAGQTAGALIPGPVSGAAGASKILSRSAQTVHYKQANATLVAGQTYEFSVVAKAGEVTDMILYGSFDGDARGATFNLLTGAWTAYSGGSAAAGSEALGSGWYRCWIRDTVPAGASVPFLIRMPTFTGDGVAGFYVDHAQVEKGNHDGVFIRKP